MVEEYIHYFQSEILVNKHFAWIHYSTIISNNYYVDNKRIWH